MYSQYLESRVRRIVTTSNANLVYTVIDRPAWTRKGDMSKEGEREGRREEEKEKKRRKGRKEREKKEPLSKCKNNKVCFRI